jgi:hypothetical protein
MNRQILQYSMLTMVVCLLLGCDSVLDDNNLQAIETPVNVRIETSQTPTLVADIVATPDPLTPTLPPTATPLPFDLEDAVSVMSGICFESAFDAVDNVFIMRNAEDHIQLYDLAENSALCRRPIIRNPFDFSNGRILTGIWTAGVGCTADHEVLDYQRDDGNKTLTFQLRFITAGDCPYELVRPFWVGIDNASDYEVIIHVERDN